MSEDSMDFEEKAKKIERRLDNMEIEDYTFNQESKTVELKLFDSEGVDSSLFAGLDEDFVEAKPLIREVEFDIIQAGVELVFNI